MFLKPLTDPDLSKQSKFTDHETKLLETLALEKLHSQRMLKEYTALHILEYFFCLKNFLLNITENLRGSGSTMSTSTMSLWKPSIGIVVTGSSTLLTSPAILITKKYILVIKMRFTKLGDSIVVNTFLYGKTLKQSMIDKK